MNDDVSDFIMTFMLQQRNEGLRLTRPFDFLLVELCIFLCGYAENHRPKEVPLPSLMADVASENAMNFSPAMLALRLPPKHKTHADAVLPSASKAASYLSKPALFAGPHQDMKHGKPRYRLTPRTKEAYTHESFRGIFPNVGAFLALPDLTIRAVDLNGYVHSVHCVAYNVKSKAMAKLAEEASGAGRRARALRPQKSGIDRRDLPEVGHYDMADCSVGYTRHQIHVTGMEESIGELRAGLLGEHGQTLG